MVMRHSSYPGLIGESARWGDLHTGRPEVREGIWQRQLDRENEIWIPRRTDILLSQLDRRNFYSTDTLYSGAGAIWWHRRRRMLL